MKLKYIKAASTLFAFTFLGLQLQAQSLTDYQNTIASPLDGGAGPALWYSNASTATENGHMTSTGSSNLSAFGLAVRRGTDYFGNANYAYGLPATATGGIAVSGSAATSIATGSSGTISLLFYTPESFGGFSSLFSRGSSGQASQLEIGLNGSTLRLGYEDSGNKTLNIGQLNTQTWYYIAVTWNTEASANDNMTWYLGEAGGTLTSGQVTITSSGDPARAIYLMGRNGSAPVLGGLFENFAIYDRALNDAAIHGQFAATQIPEPAEVALLTGLAALALIFVWKRKR